MFNSEAKLFRLTVLLLGVIGVAHLSAQALTVLVQERSAVDLLWDHYQFVRRSSTLEFSPTQPFLIKADFKLYNLDGQPLEQGTVEESWTNAEGRMIRIHSPSLTEVEPNDDYEKTQTRESYLLHQALKAIVRPFPEPPSKKDFALDNFEQQIDGSNIDCFALQAPGTWKSDKPAYCTDGDNRLIAMTGGLFMIERSDFRQYRGHETPTDLKLSYEGRPALSLHVTELDALPEESVADDKLKPAPAAGVIPGSVLAGTALSRQQPKYPKEAKKTHLSGSVVLAAVISKDGSLVNLIVIASPNPLFSQSAMDAVKTWTYKPYLLNGQPTEVDTVITVNFALNR